jgi:GAF domain-containing protein
MTRLGNSLAWRLLFWFILLALLPLAVIYFYMQQQVGKTITDAQLELLDAQARTYAAQIALAPGDEQNTTSTISNINEKNQFFLLAENGKYIAHSNPAKIGKFASDDFGFVNVRKILLVESTTIRDESRQVVIVTYRRSLSDPLAVTTVNTSELQGPLAPLTTSLLILVFISLVVVAVAGSLFFLVQLAPLHQFSQFIQQLGKKNFLATLNTSRFRGEHRLLAESLMDLSSQIQSMVLELEENVIERTRELETRATQLRAAADVSKAASSVRNLSELLQQTTKLINERFKYYHVGIFLLDERKEYAILSASNSEGGKRMLEKKHRLKVDEKSIVGYVSQNLTARIALDVGQDAVFFDNPDLPSTRSEMALPLVASGQILGVIDVQSTEQSAFSDEDVVALQILADQIAIAIQNANLFSETEKALQASREVFGDVSREAWKKVLRNQPRIGYIATPSGTAQMSAETLEPNLAKSFNTGNVITNADGLTLTVPIKVRGQVIGGIRLKKSDISDAWNQEETNLALTLSDQLSGALESARLYRESQQRAVRETLVSDISARISAASRVDAILRETVQELGQTFGNATVSFQVVEQSNGSLQEPEPGVDGVAGSESANS